MSRKDKKTRMLNNKKLSQMEEIEVGDLVKFYPPTSRGKRRPRKTHAIETYELALILDVERKKRWDPVLKERMDTIYYEIFVITSKTSKITRRFTTTEKFVKLVSKDAQNNLEMIDTIDAKSTKEVE